MSIHDDYTTVFNQAREARGKPPVNGHPIVLVREGTVLACGCHVHNASKSHYSVYHGPQCQRDIRPRTGKEIVGVPLAPNAQAVATLTGDLIGVTNPWLGLWPHEIEEMSVTACAECDSVVPANERTEEREDGQPLCGDCYARLYAERDAEDERWAYGDARYDQAREEGRRW